MRNVTLSKYALMQQASIGPFDTLSMYYILLAIDIRVNERDWKLPFPPGDAVFVTTGYLVGNVRVCLHSPSLLQWLLCRKDLEGILCDL